MKWKLPLIMTVFLITSGCLGNTSWSDLTTGTGAVAGTAIGVAVGLPPVATIVSTAAGAVGGSLAVGEPETTVDVLEAIPEQDRAKALKNQQIWEAVEHIGEWAIAAVFLFFMIPFLVGYLLPNGRQRRNTKEMIKLKEMMFDDPNYSMKDLK